MSAITRSAAVALLLLSASGCGPKPEHTAAFLKPYEQDVAGGQFRIMPPDTIEITSPNVPEIDGETQNLRPDGKITLRLIGEVYVAGLTTSEIADKLTQQLTRYYQKPIVVVRAAAGASKRYYVFGEVSGPGPYPFTGNDTLLGALAMAQPTRLAWMSQVKVVRPSHENRERHEMTIDVDEIVKHGKSTDNVLLQEGDIIHVPPTPLAWLGLQFQALLFPLNQVLATGYTPLWAREAGYQYTQPAGSGFGGRRF